MNQIYKMKLHEILLLDNQECVEITRVPGGWIYSLAYFDGNKDIINSVFVPYHNPSEFRKEGE